MWDGSTGSRGNRLRLRDVRLIRSTDINRILPRVAPVDEVLWPWVVLGDGKQPNGLLPREQLVHPEFEDLSSTGGRCCAGPEQIVKVLHVRNPSSEVLLP